jgi:UDP-glucose 4-epimerase
VRDTVQGIIAAAETPRAIGGTFNLGSGSEISIGELAQSIAKLATGRDAIIERDIPRPGDVRRLIADITKARTVLGYAPRVTLADGFAALIEHYRSLGVAPSALPAEEVRYNWLATS